MMCSEGYRRGLRPITWATSSPAATTDWESFPPCAEHPISSKRFLSGKAQTGSSAVTRPPHLEGGFFTRVGLGLDTGGTFTDAVIMDLDGTRVLYKAKAPTTREDLCIGIREAIGKMDPELLSKVGVVSLSSTLATNSIVEGKGARVALICMGGDYESSYPVDFRIKVSGAHDMRGIETEPLNTESIEAFLESMRGRVDSVAIAGYLSVRNPEHEDRVRAMADRILGIPAVCGHDLSSGLGFSERAVTCIMNARLLPVIGDLMRSMKTVLSEYGIHAPLMMVRGDGSMMSESEARRKPVETIMSGPAASLIGAMCLTGVKDAIVMDMGGTTTDIGIIRNGRPRLEPEGATIGGTRTRVMAAEISTSGIGGDSRIYVANRDARLSALRVVPICFAVRRWPSLRTFLSGLEGDAPRTGVAQDENAVVLASEFFRTLRMPSDSGDFSRTDLDLLRVLDGDPISLNEAARRMGVHPFTLNVRRLESLGLVQRVGFTPTDVLHASGDYCEYDREASLLVAAYLSRGTEMSVDGFIARCKQLIREKLCRELMLELMSEECRSSRLGPAGEDLLSKAISGLDGEYSCSIRVSKPIIGIGAPVRSYIPWVGEAFGTEVLISDDSDVGNAVGAISSSVSETMVMLIRPKSIGGNEGFLEFSKLGRFEFETLDEALAHAESIAEKAVSAAVSEGGAEDVTVTCERRDREFRYGDSGLNCLMEVELTVIAAGRPRPFSSERVLRWGDRDLEPGSSGGLGASDPESGCGHDVVDEIHSEFALVHHIEYPVADLRIDAESVVLVRYGQIPVRDAASDVDVPGSVPMYNRVREQVSEYDGERRIRKDLDAVGAGGDLDAVRDGQVLGRSHRVFKIYPYLRPHPDVAVVADERYGFIYPVESALNVAREVPAVSFQDGHGFGKASEDRPFQYGYVLPDPGGRLVHALVVGDILHECCESGVHILGAGRAVDRDGVVAVPVSDSRGESSLDRWTSVCTETVDEIYERLHLRRGHPIHAYRQLGIGFYAEDGHRHTVQECDLHVDGDERYPCRAHIGYLADDLRRSAGFLEFFAFGEYGEDLVHEQVQLRLIRTGVLVSLVGYARGPYHATVFGEYRNHKESVKAHVAFGHPFLQKPAVVLIVVDDHGSPCAHRLSPYARGVQIEFDRVVRHVAAPHRAFGPCEHPQNPAVAIVAGDESRFALGEFDGLFQSVVDDFHEVLVGHLGHLDDGLQSPGIRAAIPVHARALRRQYGMLAQLFVIDHRFGCAAIHVGRYAIVQRDCQDLFRSVLGYHHHRDRLSQAVHAPDKNPYVIAVGMIEDDNIHGIVVEHIERILDGFLGN